MAGPHTIACLFLHICDIVQQCYSTVTILLGASDEAFARAQYRRLSEDLRDRNYYEAGCLDYP